MDSSKVGKMDTLHILSLLLFKTYSGRSTIMYAKDKVS